jgi:mannose-6-phosphate isomerase-like protein (cupin superfamily)
VQYCGEPFDNDHFTQRVGPLAGAQRTDSDEVLYVLSGSGTAAIANETVELRPGVALFVAAGTEWRAAGDATVVSVLVHDPPPAGRTHAAVDLEAVERGTATGGRQFVLGATPEVGCASVTQFIGLIPPGRAPDHYHEYDEVIYVLEGSGRLFIGGEEAELGAGSCIHLPRRLMHCLANEGEGELRVLGVFRPAGSPAAAYYPDGTPAVVPTTDEES